MPKNERFIKVYLYMYHSGRNLLFCLTFSVKVSQYFAYSLLHLDFKFMKCDLILFNSELQIDNNISLNLV